MSNERNIYKLLNDLLSQSDALRATGSADIDDISTNDKLEIMKKTEDEIFKEIDNIKQCSALIMSFAIAKGRFNERINDILELIKQDER